jgi:hypothetical protein
MGRLHLCIVLLVAASLARAATMEDAGSALADRRYADAAAASTPWQ